MNTQEAIKALMSAGKGADVRELLETKGTSANHSYRQIREDKMTSAEGQRWQLAVAYTQARLGLDQRLDEMASKVVRNDRDDAERVFGVKGLPGDQGSLAISHRDAADRVAKVTDRDELRELLARATRSGDQVLARAVAEKAVENQDDRTMHQFLADRPELDAAGERLWNMKRAEGNNSFALVVHLLDITPAELRGMGRDSIEALAQNQPTTSEPASWPF